PRYRPLHPSPTRRASDLFRIATEGGAGNPGASSVRFDSNHAFDAAIAATQTSGNFCRGSSCEARISGGLFGPNGERLGVGYTIEDRKSTRLNSSHVKISY